MDRPLQANAPLSAFAGRLRLPAIAAPMFLVSGPELVVACCRAGLIGSFPALNARADRPLDRWLTEIDQALRPEDAPYAVNLIVHRSNPRLDEDLALLCQHRVPLVITSLGHPGKVVEAVHGYGGLVFSDVIQARHARKVIAAGVDGLIAVSSGAGGHAGRQHPFSLIREIRSFWQGCLALGGSISDGYALRAAEVLGADLGYLGTRFIACQESRAPEAYKTMIQTCGAEDIVYTDRVSGTAASFLWPSLAQAGYTRAMLEQPQAPGQTPSVLDSEARAWRDIWSAGHGLATIDDCPPAARLIDRLVDEYHQACAQPPSPLVRR